MRKAFVIAVSLVSLSAIPVTLHYGGYLEVRLETSEVKGKVILDGRASDEKVGVLPSFEPRNE